MKKINKEECQKNYSHEKMIQTDPNIGYNIPKNIIQNKYQKVNKTINISNINNTDSTEEIQKLQTIGDPETNKLNKYSIPKFKTDKRNSLNLKRSIEIKESDLQRRHSLLLNKLEDNSSKLKQKTFERGGKFNNVQTTYVVISKKPKAKGIPKANNIPEIIDYSKYKAIKPTPSANCLNHSNLYKGMNKSQCYTTDLKFQRKNLKEPKKFFNNKSLNNITTKRVNNYNYLDFGKNNYDSNYQNYIESSINENRDITNEQNKRDSLYFINKPININKNLIPIFDSNYEYFYDLNHIPGEFYIPSNRIYNN